MPSLFLTLLLCLSLSLFSLTPLATAANTVKFINHCPYSIFFWQVGPPGSGIDGSDSFRYTVPGNGGSVVHNMLNTEVLGGGLSLKIRDLPYYAVAPAGIIQVEYHLEPSTGAMWYDLSAVDCNHSVGPEDPMYCPLIDGTVLMYVPGAREEQCPTAKCSKTDCSNTYVREGGYKDEPSFVCPAGADLFIETCYEKAGAQTFHGVDPNALHQAVPELVAPPAPVLKELIPSPNGECGADVGFTCAGSKYGACCSQYKYCGNRPEYCNAGCLPAFGACFGENEIHPQVAGPEVLFLATVTATETESVTVREIETVIVLQTVTTTAVFTPPCVLSRAEVSTQYSGRMFTGYPRRRAAAYVGM